MPTPAQLKAEITTDPMSVGYATPYAQGNDTAVAALLNATTGAGTGAISRTSVPRGELLEALAASGGLAPLYTAASNPAATGFDAAKAATLILENPDSSVDYSRVGTQGLVAALGPAGYGILTSEQVAAVVGVCTRTGSRAEVLWGDGVTIADVDVAVARRAE